MQISLSPCLIRKPVSISIGKPVSMFTEESQCRLLQRKVSSHFLQRKTSFHFHRKARFYFFHFYRGKPVYIFTKESQILFLQGKVKFPFSIRKPFSFFQSKANFHFYKKSQFLFQRRKSVLVFTEKNLSPQESLFPCLISKASFHFYIRKLVFMKEIMFLSKA